MKPTLLLCKGSHCRKRLRASPRVERTLARLPVDVECVGCQKVCRGPVMGLPVEGGLQWFERMDSRKALDALEDWLEHERLRPRLRKRMNPRRAGRLRR